MIHIRLAAEDSRLITLEVSGHDPLGRKGSSVVCAAVSALVHALHVGLTQVTESGATVSALDGFTSFDLRGVTSREASAQLEMILATLVAIAQQSPDQVVLHMPDGINLQQ